MNKPCAVILLCLFCATAARAAVVLNATATGDTVTVSRSPDGGLNWLVPEKITITGEAVSSPRVTIGQTGQAHLIFLSSNSGMNRHRLFYTRPSTGEPRVIFESQDNIVAPQINASVESLSISWETEYEGRRTAFLTVSLDQGTNFGTVRAAPFRLMAPPAPTAARPANNTRTNLASPEISFRANNTEPVMVKLELSADQSLAPGKTWVFDRFCLPGTAETVLRLPFALADGRYYWRLSASDGFTAGPYSSPASFEIDTRPPVISLSSPTAEISDDVSIVFRGSVSEPVRLILNGQPVTLEAGGKFSCPLQLRSGQNSFELLATDEAGNSTRLVKKLFYNSAVPHFKVLRPKADDWFKPGAAFYFEAEVTSQESPEDESEGEIFVGGQALSDRPVYDQGEKKLSGFLRLPASLLDGKHTGSVSLQGGRKDFALNIDSTPPVRAPGTNEAVFTGSGTLVPLPLRDAGSGLDLPGTLVKLNGASLEVVATSETAPAARVKLPLTDGSYEVVVLPRDRVGNTGEAVSYRLVVDTLPPSLALLSNWTAETDQPRMLISGEAGDPHLAAVNFYNGANLVGTVKNAPGAFSFSCPLANGYNDLRVEAVDSAGNKASRTLTVKAELAARGLITRFAAAPVPFSPRQNETTTFTFAFSGTPELLRIYVFDLAGTLVWRQDLANYSGNSVTWNGVDVFGRRLDNGVYPYLAAVSAGGQTEIKRGKLIILN